MGCYWTKFYYTEFVIIDTENVIENKKRTEFVIDDTEFVIEQTDYVIIDTEFVIDRWREANQIKDSAATQIS